MTIGEKLVLLRGAESRADVAKAIGASVSAISMYENDARIPRDEIKVELARHYHTTVQDLFFAPKCHES